MPTESICNTRGRMYALRGPNQTRTLSYPTVRDSVLCFLQWLRRGAVRFVLRTVRQAIRKHHIPLGSKR